MLLAGNAAYITVVLAPFGIASRNTVDQGVRALIGSRGSSGRRVPEAFSFYVLSCAIAALSSGQSAKVLTVSGATGVAMIAFICPIGQHWMLYFNRCVSLRS